MKEMLARAEDIVAKAVAAGADQAEVYMERGANLSLDIEQGRITGSARSESAGGALRVLKDKRMGFAYFSRDDQAPAAIEQALSSARLAPQIDMTFPSGHKPATMDRWDDQVARLDVDALLALGKDLIEGAGDLADTALAGGISMAWGKDAIANSEAVSLADQATSLDAYASMVLQGDTPVNGWDTISQHGGTLDVASLADGVTNLVKSLQDPKPAKGGVADVVLRPAAASELLNLVLGAADGDDHHQGKTFWSESLGSEVAHTGLTIADEPHDVDGLGSTPFDGEGAATRATPIIKDGVFETLLFDARDGGRHGVPSTGHAVRGAFRAPPGTGTHHVQVRHANSVDEESLIGGVDNGFLVDSVLGAHTANGTTGDFSVTAANVWRIENGAIVGASQEVALAGNIQEWLQRLDGVSNAAKRMSGLTLPSLRVRDVDVSA